MESKKRSLAKALSWRFIATFITMAIAFVFSGEYLFAAKIGIADTLIKFAAYFAHERLWLGVRFGRYVPTDYQI
ncbi:DUF2061 domain-containing protein [Haliangium ochraceum]|nr:DUF2061 domain-containing protein [Haliangium ochraceum]